MTTKKPQILWVEDDEFQAANIWGPEIGKFFQITIRVRSETDACDSAMVHANKIDMVITDLRILSGPNQDFYPPTDGQYVYGLKLIDSLSRICPNVPVIAYSRYLRPSGTPTGNAVDLFLKGTNKNLLNFYNTEISVHPIVVQMNDKYSHFKSANLSLVEYLKAYPAAIVG